MNILHVTNGSIVSDALRAAGIPGLAIEYADVLHEGRVPADIDADSFLAIRAGVIAQLGWGVESEVLDRMAAGQRTLESCNDYDDVVLWYEHDLFDQLLLIRLLSWWWRNARSNPPHLVSPDDYLGTLTSERLVLLFDARERVSDAQMRLADHAWRAFTADDPTELVRVYRDSDNVLPHLGGALLRMLEEYPSAFNGLGRTERQIVDILAQSPLTALELFAANARREERVFMGDSTFMNRLQRMLSVRRPLIEGDIAGGPLKLTDHGVSVQEGAQDDVELNGIDRWVGNVHLTTDNIWRWNGEACEKA